VEKLGYRPALDGLRGVAILLVMASHAGLPHAKGGGNAGVVTFFALSGFLITTLLMQDGVRLGSFYARRSARLLPAVFLLVATLGVVVLASPSLRRHYWADAWPAVLYVGDLFRAQGRGLGLFAHTWSLSVEEQFYLVWPFVMLAVARLRPRAVASALTALLLADLVWRTFLIVRGGLGPGRFSFAPDTAAAGLLAGGVVAAWLAVRNVRPSPKFAYLGLGMIVGAAVLPREWISFLPPYTQVPDVLTISGTLLVIVCGIDGNRLLEWKPLNDLGRISYGVYLWHYPLVILAGSLLPSAATLLRGVIACGLAVLVASLSYRWIEQPVRNQVRHMLRARTLRGEQRLARASATATPAAVAD
jgi:peptidoglycan/LPS O-acetylase OafA/YrhL